MDRVIKQNTITKVSFTHAIMNVFLIIIHDQSHSIYTCTGHQCISAALEPGKFKSRNFDWSMRGIYLL